MIRNILIDSDCSWVVVALPRVKCRACGVVRQVKCGFADVRRTYIRGFKRFVLEQCCYMTLVDV